MSKEKTPHGNEELEPVWTDSRVAQHSAELYEIYRKLLDENREKGLGTLLMYFCVLQGRLHQLTEAFKENRKVSSGAAEVSHKAVEIFQQLDATQKNQGKNFSKRLEELEHNGF